MDTLYLFTDQDGRYILSEVKSGTYIFDLQVGDMWYAIEFTVPSTEGQKVGLDRVLLLEDYMVGDPAMDGRIVFHDAAAILIVDEEGEEDIFGAELSAGYDAELALEVVDRIDEESFWSLIFPPFDESAFSFEFFDDGFVTQEDFYFDESIFDALVTGHDEGDVGTQVVTAAP